MSSTSGRSCSLAREAASRSAQLACEQVLGRGCDGSGGAPVVRKGRGMGRGASGRKGERKEREEGDDVWNPHVSVWRGRVEGGH